MNDRIRFAVLTFLLIALFPLTLIIVLAGWLDGGLSDVVTDYTSFYRRTWGTR